MDFEGYVAALRREGSLLAGAAHRADPAGRPAGCPDWDVEDVVRHTGMVHRWATAVLRERRAAHGGYGPDEGAGLTGGALAGWLADGCAALVRELEATPPGATAFTFYPAPTAREFWARRQLHETAVHRADVEGVAGPVTPLPAEVALDGIDELVTMAGGPRRGWSGADRVLRLVPSDAPAAELVLRIGADGVRRDPGATPDCSVTAPAADLHLLLWNRPVPDPGIAGDPEVLAAWAGAVRVRWSRTLPERRGTIGG